MAKKLTYYNGIVFLNTDINLSLVLKFIYNLTEFSNKNDKILRKQLFRFFPLETVANLLISV